MRLVHIRGRNLASLAGEFSVDLEHGPLAGAGLFAIVGPTGAGKSTLLDAMCLALFDQTPRLHRSGKVPIGPATVDEDDRLTAGDARSVLTRGAISGFAEVTFVGRDGRRYRARWTARRARDRADGKLQAQVMTLVDADRDQHIGENKSATLEAIRDRLGLSFDQFCRSALLAQGEFAAFLKASGAERAELLERMTGTAIYARLSVAAHERATAEREALADLERQQSALPLLDPAERAALAAELAGRREAAERTRAEQRSAEAVVAWQARADELTAAELTAAHARDDAERRWRTAVAALRWGARAAEARRVAAVAAAKQAEKALADAERAAAKPVGLREEREHASARRSALGDLAGIVELAARAQLTASRAKAEAERCAKEHKAALAKAREAGKGLAAVVPALTEAERSLAQARAAQDLTAHRAELRDGEPCPLCGASTHPWADGSPLVRMVADFQRRVDDLKGQQKLHERAEAAAKAAAVELARAGDSAAREAKAAASTISDAEKRWQTANADALLNTPITSGSGVGPMGEGVGDRVRRASEAVERRLKEIGAAEREAERLREVADGARRAVEQARVALEATDRLVRTIEADLARAAVPGGGAPDDDLAGEAVAEARAQGRAPNDAWIAARGAELDAARSRLESAAARLAERCDQKAAHLTAAPAGIENAAHALSVLAAATQVAGGAERAYHEVRVRLETDDRLRSKGAELGPQIEKQRAVHEKWQALAELIGSHDGKKLRIFAQSLTLEALIAQANRHLDDLARRYQLMRVPGQDLELQVLDREMADEIRSVHSLSGGESFLVSLALALALSSLSQHASAVLGAGDTRVETLFIDEGFGTLDPDTLEIALGALDALQALGRQIGVISHVPGLAERIGAMVRVEPCGGGKSRVVVSYQPSTTVPRQAASNAGAAAAISLSSVARQL